MTDLTVNDLGPLDWRIGIVDSAGRPTPEFQRRWNTQRNNNVLIISITIGSGAPTGTPASDGAEYIDTTATPPVLYVGSGGSWLRVGVSRFTQLTDVPSTYVGQANKIVQVNSGESDLTFNALTTILDSLGTTEGSILYRGPTTWTVLVPGTSGQVLSTNGTGAPPSWITGGGGGGGADYVVLSLGVEPGQVVTDGGGNFIEIPANH